MLRDGGRAHDRRPRARIGIFRSCVVLVDVQEAGAGRHTRSQWQAGGVSEHGADRVVLPAALFSIEARLVGLRER